MLNYILYRIKRLFKKTPVNDVLSNTIAERSHRIEQSIEANNALLDKMKKKD